ncbi:MAG: neutral zinc metallopeptidase [Chloroflexota bacterium]
MRFDENARLDSSQVEDRRGRGGLASPGGVAVGGGGIAILVLIVGLIFGVDPATLLSVVEQTQTSAPTAEQRSADAGRESTLAQECRVGAHANAREDCRIVGFVNSIQDYWGEELPKQGTPYQPAKTRLFSGVTSTACGNASSASGPFYCPPDQSVYLDLTFFQELKTRFGAEGGPFAQAYVLAHEYGHHVQNLTGILDRMDKRSTGPQSDAVRSELMADCLAGVWAANAVETGYIERLTDQDIAQGLNAAAAVGDDRIQEKMQGRVTPESWTHGSAQQRQKWFTTGYRQGQPGACNTFQGAI